MIGTLALLRQLRAQAAAVDVYGSTGRRRPCCAACARSSFGDDPGLLDAIAAQAEQAAARIGAALDTAASWPADVYATGSRWVRAEIIAAERDLAEAARVAVEAGASNMATVIDAIYGRAEAALGALGRGAGEGFRAFWGLSPGVMLGGAAVVGVGALLALGLSGGGQAYLASIGSGAGQGIASLGAGYGAGVRGLGEGAGRSLPAILGSLR